jgi:hypothetical protein
MNSTYKQTITAVAVHLDGESPVFGESTITAALDDEAGGMFLNITDGEGNSVKVDWTQWVELNKAVIMLFSQKWEGMD